MAVFTQENPNEVLAWLDAKNFRWLLSAKHRLRAEAGHSLPGLTTDECQDCLVAYLSYLPDQGLAQDRLLNITEQV